MTTQPCFSHSTSEYPSACAEEFKARIDFVTIVIRTVGERTEAACREMLAQQVPEGHMVVVSNTPFSATLADSYRAGTERGLP